MQNPNLLNGLALAYIGDAVYEQKIREYVLSNTNLTKVSDLHRKVVSFTNGESQAKIIREIISENFINEIEIAIYKRGRNVHVNSRRKNISIADYLDATGFEALCGYLYLKGDLDRLNSIIDFAIKTVE